MTLRKRRIFMRTLATLALILSLSGCWSGDTFYATSEGVAAIPAGKYDAVYVYDAAREADESDLGKRISVKYAADGHAIIDTLEGGESSNSILVKLGDTPGLYVVQADLGAPIPKVGSAVYALVQTTAEGYQVSVPKCDERRSSVWRRAVVSGLTVGKPICAFGNREDLETALIEYAKDPINWTEYRRVVKRSKRKS
jgi:hypothetical protein